jgi:ParB family chromosome partitioning protein
MDEVKTSVRKRTKDNRLASLGKRPSGQVDMPFASTMLPPKKEEGRQVTKSVYGIRLDRVRPDPDQPRREFNDEEIRSLSESIKADGQLQPIVVRWDEPSEMYVIIAGEQRYRATTRAGLETIDCVVLEGAATKSDIRRYQLIENIFRTDLKPLEKARAFQELMDLNEWSGKELAQALKVPQSSVTETLALLKLPEDLQEKVEAEAIAPRTAYEIQKLGDPAKQRTLAAKVTAEKLTRDQTAEAVRKLKGQPTRRREPQPARKRSRMTGSQVFRLPSGARGYLSFSDDVTDADLTAIERGLASIGAILER